MRTKIILAAILLVLIIGSGAIYWRSIQVTVDKATVLNKELSGLFSKYGLTSANLTRQSIEEKKKGVRKYFHAYREYGAPKSFVSKNFEASLKEKLGKGPFKISKQDQVSTKRSDSIIFTINHGRLDVLTLQINKAKIPAMPRINKKYTNPRVAIVIDDFGYTMANINDLLSIKEAFTLSILPNLKYSREVADMAHSRSKEVILHLPLEPHRKDVGEEIDTIKTGMTRNDVALRLNSEIKSVPGITGVSNHMGSKATEDKELMTIILSNLKTRKLYFFDSLTSEKSVAWQVAESLGEPTAKRDLFLDNNSDPESIKKEILALRSFAFRKGRAIAICHDRKSTTAVLRQMMPELAEEGIKFVNLSEMVK